MRQLSIIVIVMFLLIACSPNDNINQENDNDNNTETEHANENSFNDENDEEETNDQEEEPGLISDDIKGFKEFDTINDIVKLKDHYIEIVEDNFGKRVMLIKNNDDQEVYKTIFTKKTNRLKIIEFEKGQIFNKTI